jgi:thymidylate kinase
MTPVVTESAALRSPLSFSGFAGRLFAELAARRVRYCVLHSYKNLPEAPASDLDIAVADGEFRRLPEVFAALDARGYHAVQCVNYAVRGHYFIFSWTSGSTVRTAAVDFISEHREGKLILTSGDELVRGRRPFRDFWIPSAAAEYRYLLAKKVLKGSLRSPQAHRLAELAIELGPDEARKVCARLFGRYWGALAAEASVAGTLGDLLGHLKLRLWIRVLARQPWMPIWYQITDLPRIVARLARPTGFVVAVLGPDGAGKSTLIASVGEQLEGIFRSRHVFHWRPQLLLPDRSGPVSNPHARSRFGVSRSLAHLTGHFADYYLGFALRIWPLLARTGLVLFDRYFYDLAADPKRYRYGGPSRIPEILSNTVPRPGLVLVLDAPEETLLNRKNETTAGELRIERERYSRLADHGFARRIDASRLPEAVALEACHAVLEALRSRFGSRHGRWLTPSSAAEAELAVSILSGVPDDLATGAERRFAVLPAPGAPRWMVPLDRGSQKPDRLSIYAPYTLKARLLKAGLSVAMRTPSSVWVRAIVSLPAKGPLDELVHQVLGESSAVFTVSLGTPGRYRKATVQITAGGRICGFLKVPLTAEANDRVKQEAAVLARLSAEPRVRAFLPAVLLAGEWSGRFVLLEAPLGGRPGGVRLGRAHRVFLDELAQVEPEPRKAPVLLEEIGREWECIAGGLDAASSRTVMGTLRLIERDYAALTIRCGASHGDFAPWNTRRRRDGLRVFDWEAAEWRKPCDWDMFHFQTQTVSLLRRDAGYRVHRHVPEAHCSYLMYLVHSICRLLTEQGGGGRDVQYRLRRLRDELGRGEGGRP